MNCEFNSNILDAISKNRSEKNKNQTPFPSLFCIEILLELLYCFIIRIIFGKCQPIFISEIHFEKIACNIQLDCTVNGGRIRSDKPSAGCKKAGKALGTPNCDITVEKRIDCSVSFVDWGCGRSSQACITVNILANAYRLIHGISEIPVV